MTLWLLSMAAFCSCSSDSDDTVMTGGTVMISGTVSSMDTNTPVEEVKIVFNAYSDNGSSSPINTQNVYTDSHGTFNIIAEIISTAVTCVITTEHGEYKSERKEIIVNWKGLSYDASHRTFFVNDCNFHIVKK